MVVRQFPARKCRFYPLRALSFLAYHPWVHRPRGRGVQLRIRARTGHGPRRSAVYLLSTVGPKVPIRESVGPRSCGGADGWPSFEYAARRAERGGPGRNIDHDDGMRPHFVTDQGVITHHTETGYLDPCWWPKTTLRPINESSAISAPHTFWMISWFSSRRATLTAARSGWVIGTAVKWVGHGRLPFVNHHPPRWGKFTAESSSRLPPSPVRQTSAGVRLAMQRLPEAVAGPANSELASIPTQ